MESKLAEKIERLEAQLPRWEKWLYACWGAAISMLANSICRAFESSYLAAAFFQIIENVEPESSFTIFLTDPVARNVQEALFVPYWDILGFLLFIVILIPGMVLIVHPIWRKVSLFKRFNLIFGYLLADWLVLVSLGILNSSTAGGDGFNIFVIGFLLALGLGYWWLRRKKDKAEEVFP
jgi:LPXTG-motif cell wall-anchored protein